MEGGREGGGRGGWREGGGGGAGGVEGGAWEGFLPVVQWYPFFLFVGTVLGQVLAFF